MLDRAHLPPASFSSIFIIVLTLATVASMLFLQLWIQVGHHCHLGPLPGKEQCCSHTLTNCLGGILLPRLLLGQTRVVLPSPTLPEITGLPWSQLWQLNGRDYSGLFSLLPLVLIGPLCPVGSQPCFQSAVARGLMHSLTFVLLFPVSHFPFPPHYSTKGQHVWVFAFIFVTRNQSTETPDKVRSWNKIIKPHSLQPRLASNPTTPPKAFMSQNLHFLWFLSTQTEVSKHKPLASCFFLNPSVWELSL